MRVASNTGGLGGVMLHSIETDRPRNTTLKTLLSQITPAVSSGVIGAGKIVGSSLVAVEGQFNGIFHDATTVACWERRGGVWQLHAGKSLR